jgi:hypothetical protein
MSQDTTDEPLLTLGMAAERIGVNQYDIEDAIEAGELSVISLSPVHLRVEPAEVDAKADALRERSQREAAYDAAGEAPTLTVVKDL